MILNWKLWGWRHDFLEASPPWPTVSVWFIMQIKWQNNVFCLISRISFCLMECPGTQMNILWIQNLLQNRRSLYEVVKSRHQNSDLQNHSVNFREQFVFKQQNFIMRKLPKAFSYSGYLSEKWIHPLWAIKPIDYLTWLLKPCSLRILWDWSIHPSPGRYYWAMILWYCSISNRHCSLNKQSEISHRWMILYLEKTVFLGNS